MARSVSVNHTDTAIPGVTELALNRGQVNYAADFRVKKDTSNEVILTNLTSPTSYPEEMRISISDVADVYKYSGIESGLYSLTRRGSSLLVQLNEVWKVTDSSDATYEVALPISGHIVLKVPQNDSVTAEMVEAFIGRLISGLYETGSETTSRITSMLRGSLKPADL